jgi:eukaryotic-like serine/threonine-protein kinase
MSDDAKQPDVPLTEGEVLAGKYKVERILGRGGMGVVVAATHIHLRQKVAIKFLLPDATGEVVKRFLREARAAVRLRSEHVTRVLDVGELDGGAPFMVMEYLDGSDLSRVLRKRGPLPIEEAVDYTLQACEAIAEAHSLGIVHRDLKPANLFLTTGTDGSAIVKVLDFGISKDSGQNDAGDEENQLTRTTAVLGSPYYMAPEQMRSTRSVDARADIWSLGIILYQLVTKKVPFKADSFVELALMVVNEDPKPPSTLRPDLPPELEEAILRAIKKKPDERYANVAELAAAIAPFGPASALSHATRIARVQGAPVPSIVERPSSLSVAPPPAAVATGSGSGPQSVASGSVASVSGGSVGSALSSGPSIPQAAQVTHGSPTAAPAQSIPPPAPTGQTTGSTTGSSTGATGAAWTGASPTIQARRTGAYIVGGGAALGALAVLTLLFVVRGNPDAANAQASTGATVGAEAPRAADTAPTPSVDVSAAPSATEAPSASASATAAVAEAPAPVGTGRTGSRNGTNRASAPKPVVAPAAPAPKPPAAAPPPAAPPPTAAAAPPPPAPAPSAPPKKKNVLDIDIK